MKNLSPEDYNLIELKEMPLEVVELVEQEQSRFKANSPSALQDLAKKHLGWSGAMISHSKSDYYSRHPTHTIVFNSNVCTVNHGKIWYGDIDVTLSEKKILALAEELGEQVYVLREMDGRFENEKTPKYDNAVYVTPLK